MIVALLISAFLTICKGGFLYSYAVWGLYLAIRWKNVKENPSESNTDAFAQQILVGIVVCIVITIFQLVAIFTY
jgi:4-hydroxybenzoate polyprenyltransferase